MAAAAVDVPYVSSYLGIAQPSLRTSLEAPTTELVTSILLAVAAKAREFDDIKAEKLRQEVELENAVRNGQSKTKSLKATVDKSLKEAAELREKLNQQENACSALESQLQSFKSSSSTSSSELQTLRSRITSLEASNRDTVALLESKSTGHDRLAQELLEQHQKTVDLRREISKLEQTIQNSNSAASTAKFRESNLQQELDLVRKNNEWYESELKTKSAELTKTRKEKGAKISELQRLNEDANSTIDSLRRTETTLRNRLEDVTQKADDSFAKIQKLQDDAAKQNEDNRREVESAKRLATLLESTLDQTKARLREVDQELGEVREEAANQIGAVEAERDTEKTERDLAEQRISELEENNERLETELSTMRNASSVPGTPTRGLSGTSFLGRAGSPVNRFFSPGASRLRVGPSQTDIVTDYSNLKTQLEKEKRLSRNLSLQLNQLQIDLEESSPQIQELREERDRLDSEVTSLSSLLESRGKEQEEAKKDARKWEGQVGVLRKEGDLLRQQLRDLSVQIAQLLDNDRMRKEGLDPLTAAEEIQRERIARGDTDDERYQGMTSTGRWISENLVVFQDIVELQSQNAKLLRLTRELGDKMEEDERTRLESSDTHQQQHDELISLRQEITAIKDELQAQLVKTSSITKERDMFRTMIQNRRQSQAGQDGARDFSQSVPMSGGMDHEASSQNNSDLAKMFKDLTQHFDNYRNETATDTRSLKQQADTLAAEKSKIQAELGRSTTQLTLANERYEMLQANLNMLKVENAELQKRSNTLAEGAAKRDLRSQQLAEELVEAKSMADSTRNEMSNLKAEKDLSKKIEKRLSEDNEALMNERSRLNSLITNLQNLQNERELSDAETRRKLQAQIESLESELQYTKRKLSDEIEDGKKAALRREYDHQQSQQRIDDLVASLGSAREELVAARTTKDHLQVRNDELVIELKSAEERVQLLQPRPTPRAPADTHQSMNGSADEVETADREQELAIEVSEAKRDLGLVRSELQNAKSQVEMYKGISQDAEDQLRSLGEAQEQYREEMDRLLEEKTTAIRSLEQRIEDLVQELSSRNEELSQFRSQEVERARKVEEEKAALEIEIARLRDDDERHATAAQFHQEDLKAQAEIAQQAQQNYENELVKHAEAAQALQKIRTEFNSLKVEVVELRTETEAAKSTLAQNESNWEETKQRYETELAEMRTRREDINAQNRLLHQQLESVSTQITALKQQRSDAQGQDDLPLQSDTSASDRSVQDLREVIRYLRREKEIVDVQYELSIQESKRMKQQLDYAQTQLDEARLKLDQERRAHADQGRSSIAHNQLMEKMNELNLFRESNTTLRNEVRQAQTQLAEKSSRIDELLAQVQPLEAKVRELENAKELSEGEMKILQEDKDRWQQRTQTILSKYDRIDPAEMDALREKISGLESERDGLLAEKATIDQLNEQIAGIPEQIRVAQEEAIKPWQAQREKIRERAQNMVKDVREKLTNEKNQLEQQFSEVKQELENTKTELDQTKASITSQQAQQAQQQSSNESISRSDGGQASGISSEEEKVLQDKLAASEAEKASLLAETATLKAQRTSDLAKIADLQSQVQILEQRIQTLNSQIQQTQINQQAEASSNSMESPDQVEQLQRELLEAQTEVESLKANATINASISNLPAEDGSKSVAEQIAEQAESIRAELSAQYNARFLQAEEKFKRRSDSMKDQLNTRLKEGKQNAKKDVATEHEAALQQLKTEHKQELERLTLQHSADLERIKSEEQIKLAQEKQIWLAENAAPAKAAPAPDSKPPQSPNVQNLSDVEARRLVATNETIKSIVRSNITNQVTKVKAEQQTLLEQKLAEAQSKHSAAKDQAVAMEGKKYAVKLSMAENKAKSTSAKLGVVEKAATETPDRAVAEVWKIAKETKPAPTLQQAVTAKATNNPAGQASAMTTRQASSQLQAPTTNGVTNPAQTKQESTESQSATIDAPAAPTDSSLATTATAGNQPPESNGPIEQTAATSGVPVKPVASSANTNAGTGPKALQSILPPGHSAIPRGGAASARGRGGGRGGQAVQAPGTGVPQPSANTRGGASGLPRGGGRGRGRGGPQGVQTTGLPQQQGTGSPTSGRGGLNANARQFVPTGNKRARESEGDDGAAGKRPRGGGAGN